MSDRLAELLRQRALLQEHLAWLNAEIASAAEKSPAQPPTPSDVSLSAPLPTTSAETPAASMRAAVVSTTIAAHVVPPVGAAAPGVDAILEKYRVAPNTVQQDVRKGCFLYFALGFIVFGLGVVALYFAISRR